MIRKAWSYLIFTLFWLVFVTLSRWDWDWYLIGFWLGAVIGTLLIDLDHLFDILIVHPSEPISQKIKDFLVRRQYQPAFEFLTDTHFDRTRLTFHNAVFQIGFIIFCFWAIISTDSWMGKGLVMAINLHLFKDEITLLKYRGEAYTRDWLFWPVRLNISYSVLKLYLAVVAVLLLGLSWLLI